MKRPKEGEYDTSLASVSMYSRGILPMAMTQAAHTLTVQQVALLRKHLELLLQSPHFCNSKRYPRFLQKIVECTMRGDLDQLKERSLGLSVFDRSPDYDTGADPIVRITAGEVRKRLAQYYQERGYEDAVQVSLSVGTYMPEFHFLSEGEKREETDSHPENSRRKPPAVSQPAKNTNAPASELKPAAAREPYPATKTSSRFSQSPFRVACLSAAIAILIVAGAYFSTQAFRESRTRALNRFWAPMMAGNDQAAFVIGRATLVVPGDSDPSLRAAFQGMKSKIAISDAIPFSRICGILRTESRDCTMQLSNQASIADMSRRPTVLIGLLNNEWSTRLTSQLRFQMNSNVDADGATHEAWIYDARNLKAHWGIDFGQRLDTVTRDFGLLARFDSQVTDQPTILVGGLSALGTQSIGEFATDERSMQSLEDMMPSGKSFRNVEAVMETEVIDGKSGHSRVVAVDFW